MRIKSEHTTAGQQSRRGFMRRGWRKMTWALIAWSALTVIGGLALSGHTANKLNSQCQHAWIDRSICQQVGSQTASNQFEHILKIGIAGFAILAAIWFMTRPREQHAVAEMDRRQQDGEAVTRLQPSAPSQPRPQRRTSGQLPLVVLGLLAAAGVAVGGLAAAGAFSHTPSTRIITRVIRAHSTASQAPSDTAAPAPQQTAPPAPVTDSSSVSGPTSCGGDLSVGPNTSCRFAENVESAYGETSGGEQVVTAYSPAMGQTYTIACSAGLQHVCTGGSTNDASVYFTSDPASAGASRSSGGSALSACDANVSVNRVTSCQFAANVFQGYVEQYHANGAQPVMTVRAYSPVTHLTYNMACVSNGTTVNCTGGKDSFLTFSLEAVQY